MTDQTTTSTGATIPLSTQVGGHAGVQTTEDGSLIIKPALALEHEFYQSLTTNDSFQALRPFVPKFYGTLKLEGQVDGSEGGGVKASLVLENLSHPFQKPNILDIKLGTKMYDESAPPEKVERMLKAARDTTSLETGVRLTGFQVYDNETGEAVNTPKAYGKSLKPSDLPEGIARFFPVSSESSSKGLPLHLLLPILENIREDVAEIREAFAGIEMRMIGGSVLVIYEADIKKAEGGVAWLKKLEEEGPPEEQDDDDENEDEDEKSKPGSPYVVKLIDFGHARFEPGQGPDQGVLKGIDTVLRLLDGRIGELNKNQGS
ncbi:hypothetical protein V5O48_010908 [Marasmius crinis-equi]|uniref:Kinase n=1 Tax=Marasmius crinis-equi TaxID=585013 RepID=A0ABR3F730_9AGAR